MWVCGGRGKGFSRASVIQRDFILRLIEEFFMFLAKALGTFQKKDIPRAEASIDLAYRRFLGLSAEFAERTSIDSLLALFRVDPDRSASQCLIAAELMRARGMIRREQGTDEQAERLFLRAVAFYLESLPLPSQAETLAYQPGLREAYEGCKNRLGPDEIARITALLDPPGQERS